MSGFLENVVNRATKKQPFMVTPALTPDRLQDIYFQPERGQNAVPRMPSSEYAESNLTAPAEKSTIRESKIETTSFTPTPPKNIARSPKKTDNPPKLDNDKIDYVSVVQARNNPSMRNDQAEVAQPPKESIELPDQTSVVQEKPLEVSSPNRIVPAAALTENTYTSKQNSPSAESKRQLSATQNDQSPKPKANIQATRPTASQVEFKAENRKQTNPVYPKPMSKETDAAVTEAQSAPANLPPKKPAQPIHISPKIESKITLSERPSEVVVTIKKIMTASEDNYSKTQSEEEHQSSSSAERVVTFASNTKSSMSKTPEAKLKPEVAEVSAEQSAKPVGAKSAAEPPKLQPASAVNEKMGRPQTSSEPTVTVRIGRIEVRAVQASEQNVAAPRSPALSLNDYLKQHLEVS